MSFAEPGVAIVRCVQCGTFERIPDASVADVNRWYETHRCSPGVTERTPDAP